MRKFLAVLFCSVAFVPAAQAQTADEGRDALVKSCMGTATAQTDPERAEYCGCVRNSMQNWTEQDFKDIADQAAKAHSAGEESPKLQEVAKACITKVLGNMPQ